MSSGTPNRSSPPPSAPGRVAPIPLVDELPELEIIDDGPEPILLPTPSSSPAVTPLGAPAPLSQILEDVSPERDRIVVLGRRQSGKTIFLASIYHKLWRSVDGLTAKALSGDIHKQLITTYEQLQKGEWPASTLGTSQIDLELEYHGKKRLLVALDFAGELFSKAFVDQLDHWPGVRELVSHIDRAAAVLLLVDPAVASGADSNAAMDDDFGLVQAVQRIRNWPGGDGVPIVLVFTKCDQNEALIDKAGGALDFARKHFKALLRVLKELPVIQISACQTEVDRETKKRRPKRDSTPINLDNPLRYCLCALEKSEELAERKQRDEDRRMMAAQAIRQRQEATMRESRSTKMIATLIAGVGSLLVALILYFRI